MRLPSDADDRDPRAAERGRARRSGRQRSPDAPDRRGRDLPDAVDVLVVGGGLMGLSAARRAAELGASVALLEAERIGWGASTRNGGFCHPGFKQPLTTLRRLHGVGAGRGALPRDDRGLRARRAPVHDVHRRRLRAHRPPGARVGAVPRRRVRRPPWRRCAAWAWRRTWSARSDLRTEIGSDAYFGGLVVEQSAGLNPAKLTAGLADLAEAAGAALHEETRRDQDPARRPMAGRSSRPRAARSSRQDVIVGTNGYTGGLTPSLRRRIMAISSFIIVTEPLAPDVAAEISPRRTAVLRHQELSSTTGG